jgi:hypothetical protein
VEVEGSWRLDCPYASAVWLFGLNGNASISLTDVQTKALLVKKLYRESRWLEIQTEESSAIWDLFNSVWKSILLVY